MKRAEGVANVILAGDGFHVVVDDAERRIPELRARLAAAQLPFDALVKTTATIEDLLVTAVEPGGPRVES